MVPLGNLLCPKHFWKTIKPNITDKVLKDEKITLVENDEVITVEVDLAKIFKDHFENIVEAFILNALVK